MADQRLTDKSFIDNIQDDDLIHIVDVSNTSFNPSGRSTKASWLKIKTTLKQYFDGFYNQGTAATPNLQQVTDEGSVTTNQIETPFIRESGVLNEGTGIVEIGDVNNLYTFFKFIVDTDKELVYANDVRGGRISIGSINGINIANIFTNNLTASRNYELPDEAGDLVVQNTGTFTPVLQDTNGNLTYSGTFTGNYVKIGSICHFNINMSGVSSTGTPSGGFLRISGIPFNQDVNLIQSYNVSYMLGFGTNFYSVTARSNGTGSIDILTQSDLDDSIQTLYPVNTVTNAGINISGTYIIA